jgi:hypothetical protein
MAKSLRLQYILLLVLSSTMIMKAQSTFNVDRGRILNPSQYFEKQGKSSNFLLRVGYRSMALNNPTYENRMKNHEISYKGGGEVSLGICTYPFFIEFGAFYGTYNVNEEHFGEFYPKLKDKSIVNAGGNIYLNFFPLPNMNRFTDIVRPYMGIGVQSSSITVHSSNTKDESEPEPVLGLHGVMGKMGLMISFGSISLSGEYRQRIGAKETEDYYEWAAGLTFGI